MIHPADIIKDIKTLSGMKVLFINMPLRETALPNNTPQGILLLATNLRDNYNVNCSVIDLNGYRVKDQQAEIQGLTNGRHLTLKETYNLINKHIKVNGEPDLVCFSGMITTLKWQQETAKIIRQLLPDVFLVSGNGLATELKTGLFTYIPELDAVAHSEGDDVIVKICYDAKLIKEKGIDKAILSGKLQPYYIGKNGRHRFMYEGNRPKDLNNIPFADLDFLNQDVYGYNMLEYYLGNAIWGASANNSSATSFEMKRSVNVVSSRGCPFSCRYCFRGAQGERFYGTRSAQNLAQELELYKEKYNIDFMGYVDDNFAVNHQRMVDLAPLLKPLNIRWGTHTRLDEASGIKMAGENIKYEMPKRIDKMAEAGCIYIGFGAESASAKVLEAMNKGGFTLKNGMENIKVDGKMYEFPLSMTEGIRNCEYAGIHANATWILGYPSETLQDLKTSVAFIKWQETFYDSQGKSSDSVNKKMFLATFYPGTEMGYNPKVKSVLTSVFGIKFDNMQQPICDKNLYKYLVSLDDATKLITNPMTKEPINYSDMPTDILLKAKEKIEEGKIYDIIDM